MFASQIYFIKDLVKVMSFLYVIKIVDIFFTPTKYYRTNITKKITDEYDIITCEKLQIQKMLTNKSLSKKISDASFYEIIRQLEYKSKFKGKLFYQIDLYYPSSQECSVCSSIDKNYKDISKREYDCHKCHHHMDRDLNASINVMYEGLKLYLQEKLKI